MSRKMLTTFAKDKKCKNYILNLCEYKYEF